MLYAFLSLLLQPWPSTLSLHTFPIQKSWLGQWGGGPIVSTLPIQTHHNYVSWEVSGARQVPIL